MPLEFLDFIIANTRSPPRPGQEIATWPRNVGDDPCHRGPANRGTTRFGSFGIDNLTIGAS